MKFTKKIVKIGLSSGIIIDIPFMKQMKLKPGELVEISMKKVKGKK